MNDTTFPHRTSDLLERLVAIEAGIHADRHRQPPAVLEEIARLWASGATVPGIAARTGISPEIVRDRLHRTGVLDYVQRERRRHVRKVLEQRGPKLIAAYQAGAPITTLAARAGVSDHTIRAYLVSEGVTIRPMTGKAWKIIHPRSAELTSAYEAGTSIRALAARVGVNAGAIHLLLIRERVTLRHDVGRPRKRTVPERSPGE